MKQNITKEQLQELSDYQFEKLYDYWWNEKNEPRNPYTPTELVEYGLGTKYRLPLMSIGDMLEYFTYNKCDINIILNYSMLICELKINSLYFDDMELADALWWAIKIHLDK